jgi:shikimate dehydrogenase
VTRRFVLIGHPVAHSVSPAIHHAAYEKLRIDCSYELVDAPDDVAVRSIVEALKSGEIAGANVTVPHKKLALALADRADTLARAIGAANVLVRDADGAVSAHNTDVAALAEELLRGATGARVAAVIGSGGAALAAIAACRSIGVRQVAVVSRRWRASNDPASWPGADAFRALGATITAWPERPASAREEQERVADDTWEALALSSQIVIQATSAGMHGADSGEIVRDIVPWLRLDRSVLAYDVVYNPPVTPFLEAARAAGLVVEGGLGMLVGQAALAIERWLGVAAPREQMRRAAEHALARRSAT